MMPPVDERWSRVKEVFAAAMDLAPKERAILIGKECGEDESLRREIESLLESDAHAASFIEQPAGEIPRDLFPEGGDDAFTGRQFGTYQIIREIGRGGLGAVYLAARADDAYRKEVAIKLIRRGLDTEDILSRFRNERQILAQLDHPNIARLIDGGTTADGLPYFVMEYVNGQPIGAYCDAHALSVTERLNLFRKVCAAVAYAHQNLVIHRDLKPSNILVAADGEPKLLDFGIAKLLSADDELLTQTVSALRVMTPEYASPEQVKGEKITTTSDVYSLGVLLYEILTARRPYRLKTRSTEEIARAITEQEPERPSAAIARGDGNPKTQNPNPKLLRGDLDNIVLMAMRKDPARRYATVGQFSDDIRRHLEGLPVIAHKDTFGYRASKFVTRHKAGVIATALVVVALLAGIVTTLREKRRAERRFNDVRQLSNALLTDIAPKIERLPGSTQARQSILAQSLKYLDSLAKESASDPVLQGELAAAYEKVGDLQGNPTNPNLIALGDALASYEKAHAIRQKLVVNDPRNAEQRRLLAHNYSLLADILWQTNQPGESLKNSETALRLYTELLKESPGSTELRLACIRANEGIGTSLSTNEKYAQAIDYYQKGVEAAEELRQQSPNRVDLLILLGNCRRGLAYSLSWEGKQQEAEPEMEKALAIYEALFAANPNDMSIRNGLQLTYALTSSLYEGTDDRRATEYALKALRIISENVEKDPANLRAKQQLAASYSNVGVTLGNEDKTAESILHLEKAVVILEELVRNETKNRRFKHNLATAFIRLGDTRHKQGEFAAAITDLEKAAAILTELATSDATDNSSLRNLANACDSLWKAHEALAAQSNPEKAASHRHSAREQLQRAVDSLRQLEARNALSKYDQKSFEQLQVALQKYAQE